MREPINEARAAAAVPAAPTDPAQRLQLVDALRGLALFGIMIVNLGDFTLYWGLSAEQKAMLPTAATARAAEPLAMASVAAFTLVWLSPAPQQWLAQLAPAGRAALTVYLSQTVICGALFYGVGPGLGGKVGWTLIPPIALALIAVQIALSAVWLRSFRFGPVEWLWRALTYGRVVPLLRGTERVDAVTETVAASSS